MIQIFCNALEFFAFVFLYYAILNQKFSFNKHIFLLFIYILPEILFSLFHMNIPVEIDFLLSFSLLIAYAKSLFNTDIINCLCIYMSTYFMLTLFQITLTIVNNYIFHISNDYALPILGNIYTLTVSLICYRFINLKHWFSFLFESGKTGKFVMVNLYTTAIIIVFYFNSNLNTYYENILFIVVAFAILIIANLLLSNQLGRLKKQEARLNAYNEYLPVLEELIQAVRIKQHNYNNQLQSIAGLIYTHKDYASLSAALDKHFKLISDSDVPEYLLKINLPVVAGFLYQKSNEAKKNSKLICFEFKTYQLTSKIPEYTLIEMFGILIDNALEAISSGSCAYITIDSRDKHIIFTTRNSGYILTDNDRRLFFTKGYSNKPDNAPHSGLGLYHLNNLLKQHPSGRISLWNEDTDILFQIIV